MDRTPEMMTHVAGSTEASTHAGEYAYRLMEEGYHCSEAVLLAVGEYLVGEVPGAVLRASNGFRGGVGSTHEELCGALSGGVMALGLVHGRENGTQDDRFAAEIVRRWRDRFQAHFRYTQCDPIYRLVREPGAPGTCAVVAGEAAELLVQMLETELERCPE